MTDDVIMALGRSVSALSKSTDAVDEGGQLGADDVTVGCLRSGGYSEEFLDRLEPNGNIPKHGSLYRGKDRRHVCLLCTRISLCILQIYILVGHMTHLSWSTKSSSTKFVKLYIK